jgi:hypothetical protein
MPNGEDIERVVLPVQEKAIFTSRLMIPSLLGHFQNIACIAFLSQ